MTKCAAKPILPGPLTNTVYYKGYKYSSIQRLHEAGKMHGVKRVALFCVMTAILPSMLIITPLYLRHSIFADVQYSVAESDVVEIKEGISSVFCDSHTLSMNSSFNAFKLESKPALSGKRKHIRLKKSMSLPDDTLEYWGFYLLGGATVYLKVCSRYEGARILIVRGERNLKTCGLMEHNMDKFGATMDQESARVKVTFETAAQEIQDSLENAKKPKYDPNTALEDETNDDNVSAHVDEYLQQRSKNNKPENATEHNQTEPKNVTSPEPLNLTESAHHRRHGRKRFLEKQEQLYKLQESLKSDEEVDLHITRTKRETGLLLDGGIEHGGNALNYSQTSGESVSSFETSLLACYDGSILVSQGFAPSHLCNNVQYLEKMEHMAIEFDVASDGYYYYIFYSDNDFVNNDIHAVFDIYKPTFQYSNLSENIECVNKTTCTFPISFWSDQSVILEVPTRDGIEHDEDDITLLVSTCHPRMSVYMIFPITVMFLVLGCAFL